MLRHGMAHSIALGEVAQRADIPDTRGGHCDGMGG
jgi:hypothetical protein